MRSGLFKTHTSDWCVAACSEEQTFNAHKEEPHFLITPQMDMTNVRANIGAYIYLYDLGPDILGTASLGVLLWKRNLISLSV